MKILVLNAGSSSIKFQLLDMTDTTVIASGIVERIGQTDAITSFEIGKNEHRSVMAIANHKEALQQVVHLLLDPEKGVVGNVDDITAVGHRVVHGGNEFTDTTLIDENVKHKIGEFASLAPLHNPHNLEGIEVATSLFPNARQVAVFDTAFHQTIPVKASKYALPSELFDEHHIQLYGFHGTSHKYVSQQAIDYLKLKKSKIISIHLGNGCSMTAIENGKSIDHSLGFAPSNGLIMGSRSGDIDHAIIFHLVNKLGYQLEDVERMISKESGMLGLTGFSDLREIQQAASDGDKNCQLALEMNAYRIKKYIGSYTAAMNGVDVIIFTAGIGENSSLLRAMVCADMNYLGISMDAKANKQRSDELFEIQSGISQVKILVIPTNEELEIANQVKTLLEQ
ncbi:acetate/propionate family kinase [Nonlabens ponticola]|uniref:Acetate kinase n=1 Tax=Nonlabens ponticola TaxID=2496866 RepID=A0A3S9N0M0_9FLAO|nr:acetate kinase [Nonlabens ponticola]AZQ44872.1 acetate kinase [Nonlabens ponticola]